MKSKPENISDSILAPMFLTRTETAPQQSQWLYKI